MRMKSGYCGGLEARSQAAATHPKKSIFYGITRFKIFINAFRLSHTFQCLIDHFTRYVGEEYMIRCKAYRWQWFKTKSAH